jgi:hypothetical protein
MITRQPYQKSVNAGPNGRHEVNMTTAKMRPPLLGGFFLGKKNSSFLINREIEIGDRCIGNLEM